MAPIFELWLASVTLAGIGGYLACWLVNARREAKRAAEQAAELLDEIERICNGAVAAAVDFVICELDYRLGPTPAERLCDPMPALNTVREGVQAIEERLATLTWAVMAALPTKQAEADADSDRRASSYEVGYNDGYAQGYKDGHTDGWDRAWESANSYLVNQDDPQDDPFVPDEAPGPAD